jgi:hypothetical protein
MTSVCSICGLPFDEYGHNARPVNDGRCCNRCQDAVVIPARIKAMREQAAKEEKHATLVSRSIDDAP